jgi:uncharacterized protein (TIGR02246 family)
MVRTVLVTWVLVGSVALAQPAPTSVPQKPTGSEAEVRAAHAKFQEAWNHHDPAAMAAAWTDDGDYTEPDGRTVFGRAEVQRLLTYEHKSVFKQSELHLVIERVRFVRDDVAIVDGSYELFKATNSGGNPIGTRTGYFVTVLVKDGGTWKVSAGRLFLPVQLLWREKK